jgi:hypothetical protein
MPKFTTHPYGYLMDEAAYLPEAEQCFDVASPVVKQIIGSLLSRHRVGSIANASLSYAERW